MTNVEFYADNTDPELVEVKVEIALYEKTRTVIAYGYAEVGEYLDDTEGALREVYGEFTGWLDGFKEAMKLVGKNVAVAGVTSR